VVIDSTDPESMMCRGSKGLPDGWRDVDFSGGHQQRVVAVTCEDGSCSLWDWERGLQLLRLALPEGGHNPHRRQLR
jgi:hypothetical protein